MKRINEDVNVTDPALAAKYISTQRSINDRLKKIAQIQNEIVTYKQQLAGIEELAIKKNAATIQATTKQGQNTKNTTQPNENAPAISNESKIPTYEEFLLENELINKRVKLIRMVNDPDEIDPGTEGTIIHIGGGVINVKWDNGRNLGLIDGVDQYEIIN